MNNPRSRAVGVVRLSKETDETTSPERQKAKITQWAELHEVEIVGWAVDIDVSAGIPPEERPELGEWLRKTDEYEYLVAAKLDRLTRSLRDFVNLSHDLKERGVSLVVVHENMDMSTNTGWLIANILAIFAEFERETIRERVKEAYEELVRSGRFPGGLPPYGYMPEIRTLPNGRRGVFLIIDPEQQKTLLRIVDMICEEKKTPRAVAEVLNEEKIPSPFDANEIRQGRPPRGTKWTGSNLIKLLRSKTLLGQFEGTDEAGGVVRGDDGLPVQRAEPIIDTTTWVKLQKRLDSRKNQRSTAKNAADSLRGVFRCMACSRPLYLMVQRRAGQPVHRYYGHTTADRKECSSRALVASEGMRVLEESLLALLGRLPRMERVENPGAIHGPKLAQIEQSMAELEAYRYERGLFAGEAGAKRFQSLYAKLEQQHAALSALIGPEVADEWRPLEETFGEWWKRMSWEERGQALRDFDVTLMHRDMSPKRTKKREPEYALLLGSISQAYGLATNISVQGKNPQEMVNEINRQARPSRVPSFVKIGRITMRDS